MKIRLLLVLTCLQLSVFAQLPNRMHEMRGIKDSAHALYLSLYSNNYFKNNEYFLDHLSGYTLFGTQNVLALTYKPHAMVQVQGGVYLKKDFGRNGFTTVQPYYRLEIAKNGYSIGFGNLRGNASHRMLDPIFSQERLMSDFLEHGIQLKVNRKNIYSETWIDWQRQQVYNADYNEVFVVGHHTSLPIYANDKTRFSASLQALANHSGGQWDTTNLPSSTIVNAALGLQWQQKFDTGSFFRTIGANAHYLLYRDLANNAGLPYREGSGIYANLNFRFQKGFKAYLGYWQGRDFIAPLGNVLFQSTIHNPQNPNALAPERQILLLGLGYQKRIIPNLALDARLEPFFDLQAESVNYNYALYITYQPGFLLKKFKRKDVR